MVVVVDAMTVVVNIGAVVVTMVVVTTGIVAVVTVVVSTGMVVVVTVEDAGTILELVPVINGLTKVDDCCCADADVVLDGITMVVVDDAASVDVKTSSEELDVPSDVITPCVVPLDTDTVDSTDGSLADISVESVVASKQIGRAHV